MDSSSFYIVNVSQNALNFTSMLWQLWSCALCESHMNQSLPHPECQKMTMSLVVKGDPIIIGMDIHIHLTIYNISTCHNNKWWKVVSIDEWMMDFYELSFLSLSLSLLCNLFPSLFILSTHLIFSLHTNNHEDLHDFPLYKAI